MKQLKFKFNLIMIFLIISSQYKALATWPSKDLNIRTNPNGTVYLDTQGNPIQNVNDTTAYNMEKLLKLNVNAKSRSYPNHFST